MKTAVLPEKEIDPTLTGSTSSPWSEGGTPASTLTYNGTGRCNNVTVPTIAKPESLIAVRAVMRSFVIRCNSPKPTLSSASENST